MNEKPLERLNYYNGQPLDAPAFKTEQDYHIRTRRWLNKSLYSAGIARGLEVRAVPGSRTVTVSPGLALDSEGREIILLEQAPVEVCSYAGTSESTVEGNYLVIEYAEETIAHERGGCAVRAPGTSASKSTAPWGGPARIQAQVKFSWVPFVPQPGSNQIVLARVELTSPNCDSVHQIDAGARRYVGAASAANVRQYALEGEREVAFIPKESFPAPKQGEVDKRKDVEVVGRIYFHIRGRQPNSVTLYLRSDSFSVLRYTELGAHTHSASTSTSIDDHHITPGDISHVHGLTGVITDVEKEDDTFGSGGRPPHFHTIQANLAKHFDPFGRPNDNIGAYNIDISARPTLVPAGTEFHTEQLDNDVIAATSLNPFQRIIGEGAHRHRLVMEDGQALKTARPSEFTEIVLQHTNLSSASTIDPSGVALPSRNGQPLTFVDSLQILLGPAGDVVRTVRRTADIQNQLADANSAIWRQRSKIGEAGVQGDPLKERGTGPIRLDFLPDIVFVGGEEYCIELKVGAKTDGAGNKLPNGGKILYNLYIE